MSRTELRIAPASHMHGHLNGMTAVIIDVYNRNVPICVIFRCSVSSICFEMLMLSAGSSVLVTQNNKPAFTRHENVNIHTGILNQPLSCNKMKMSP